MNTINSPEILSSKTNTDTVVSKIQEKIIYCISSMCANCKMFDNIELPQGYVKQYIERLIPDEEETLEAYTHRMAENIDTSQPFILMGCSFGAIIMQEMNRFLHPEKNIVVSSMKHLDEIPFLFKTVKATHLAKKFPKKLYAVNEQTKKLFVRLIYNMSENELGRYVSYTSPEYLKRAFCQITQRKPSIKCKNLYHIHGTKDQIFPSQQIKNAYMVEGGDHLMIYRKSKEVNKILKEILSK
jgi:hypothetical protein